MSKLIDHHSASIFSEHEHAWNAGQQPDFKVAIRCMQPSITADELCHFLKMDMENRIKRGHSIGVLRLYRESIEPGLFTPIELDLFYHEFLELVYHRPKQSRDEFLGYYSEYSAVAERHLLRSRVACTKCKKETEANEEIDPNCQKCNAPFRVVKRVPSVPGYEILGELGRGGMGVVYKAEHIPLKRIVALKMILVAGHASTSALNRFRKEAEVVAELKHPNIVQIHESGDVSGLDYLSLEYLEGGTLAAKIHDHRLSPMEAAEIVEPLARAIAAAHVKGIVHRDLKPANVLLAKDGTPKITDFGLVKRMEEVEGHTRSGVPVGTPNYMSPEQARGEKTVGPATDIYALGAILYRLTTGRPPFAGDSQMETIRRVIEEDLVPPRQWEPNIPRDFEAICLKCLEKNAAERYDSALSLATDLRRFLEGDTTSVRPAGLVARFWRLVAPGARTGRMRRWRRLIFAGGILGFAHNTTFYLFQQNAAPTIWFAGLNSLALLACAYFYWQAWRATAKPKTESQESYATAQLEKEQREAFAIALSTGVGLLLIVLTVDVIIHSGRLGSSNLSWPFICICGVQGSWLLARRIGGILNAIVVGFTLLAVWTAMDQPRAPLVFGIGWLIMFTAAGITVPGRDPTEPTTKP